jgi:hypothetical protein
MRYSAFTLLLLGCSLALAQTVYKWVDENGVTHYSDQPHAKAEKMTVPAAQTYTAPANAGADTSAATPPPAEDTGYYQGCAIVQPANAQSFANIDSLSVVVQTDPPLRREDRIFLMLDGQPLNGGAPTGTSFTLEPVERGTHTLQAVVRDGQRGMLCQTPGVTFEVHQNSILNPANPQNPRPTPH